MIQLNLLPDVKLQYIRAKQRKRMVIGISTVVSAFFVAIFIFLLLFVRIAQKQHLSALNRDIESSTKELKSKQDLEKILTIQNQLNSLPALHDEKVISSRLFDYLTQVTPTQATFSDVVIDFTNNTIIISGNADALSTVNKFADTLKFTDYSVAGENPQQGKAFTNVVLGDFSVGGTGGSQGQGNVSYELEFNFEPLIFANIKKVDPANEEELVKLTIPNIISTRSETEKPGELFLPQPDQFNEGTE